VREPNEGGLSHKSASLVAGAEQLRGRCRMSSIIRNGVTIRGISVDGRGVFTEGRADVVAYAGQHKDGYACGLGLTTFSGGDQGYAEHGPYGKFDGRCLRRYTYGNTSYTAYSLYERGKEKEYARVYADGLRCMYNREFCNPDNPYLLALIAQVAPVEVRAAAIAPHPPSPLTRPKAIVRWIRRLVLPPQALATAMATEVHPHTARRR
jgi:hypothetical protein